MRADPGRLRVALTTEPWGGSSVDAQVAAATVAAGTILEWIGHTVTETRPALRRGGRRRGDDTHCDRHGRGDPARSTQARSRSARSGLAAGARRRPRRSPRSTSWQRLDAQHRVTRSIGLFFTRFDLLVTPTVALAAGAARHPRLRRPRHSVRSWLRRIFEFGPFTAPFNVSGNPAISLPLALSREGLPIGVQLVAAYGREDLLLQVAAQLEQAAPWKDRQPSIFVD